MQDNEFHGLKIVCRCGAGGFGEVFFCEDISGRKLALKVVPKSALGEAWERELRGVINYRKITEDHPELLQIFHVQEDSDSFFYTMEAADPAASAGDGASADSSYLPDTLAQRLQSGALPLAELFPVLYGVFSGIKAIHSAGFTHRDIKPDNILFVKGVPKLADIGLVSSLSATVTQLAGTLEFIPPEERSADSLDSSDRRARQRNDLYAFGKVVYCAATGCSPQEFPSLPKDISLTPQLKYFVQLAFQLCCKDPLRRINSVAELDKELANIARKLESGETFADKFSFLCRSLGRYFKSLPVNSWRFFKNYWFWVLSPALVVGGSAWWMLKPAPPLDITMLKTKDYISSYHKISMKVLAKWEIISRETLIKIMQRLKEHNPQQPLPNITLEQAQIVEKSLLNGQEMIFCDFDRQFADNINVCVDQSMLQLMSFSDEELRLALKTIFEKNLKFSLNIFDCKRTVLGGYNAIALDYTIMPGSIRSYSYWINFNGKVLSLTLTAKVSTFEQRKKEFEAVISTLKFEK